MESVTLMGLMKRLARFLLRRIADGMGISAMANELAETRRICNELEYQIARAPDGLPLPSHKLHTLVCGNPELRVTDFLTIGESCASGVKGLLSKHGIAMETMDSILDFGCGCGRVLRHFKDLPGKLSGTDYNPELITWSRENLPFAEFSVNKLEPPLSYADASFDLIYSFSVFTHLAPPLQVPWMQELRRVLRPGGHIFVTVHGMPYAQRINGAARKDFEDGRLSMVSEELSGENRCAAYHPTHYVIHTLAEGFACVEHVEGAVVDARRHIIAQDVYLLRKL